MKIITPTPIGDAQFVSSTVPETDYPEWAAATAYAKGDRVIRASLHHCYERLAAGTTATAPESDPTNWLDLGATNRWAQFDTKASTVTSATESMTTTIAPGLVNALALIGLQGSTVQVTMTDPTDGLVYDKTVSLYDPLGVTDWYAYFFDDIRSKSIALFLDLPSYSAAQVAVTVSGGAGTTVAVGACLPGRLRAFAPAVAYGASVGIQDYSRKETDQWGNWSVVKRAFAKRARWSFLLANSDVDVLQAQLAALRATPAVYIGGGNFDSTTIYGFFKDFDVVIQYPTMSECQIEIEGLT